MRDPLVRRCACCNQPLQLDLYNPAPGRIEPKWLVKCLTPGCKLEKCTFTDGEYREDAAAHRFEQHPDWQPVQSSN